MTAWTNDLVNSPTTAWTPFGLALVFTWAEAGAAGVTWASAATNGNTWTTGVGSGVVTEIWSRT